jgi:protein gp37
MGENTAIEWADHTFNPWIGCTKVSPACDHCYAERLATARLGVAWGPCAERRRTAASTWTQPLAWNRKAQREGRRFRVFCASLADVFDNAVPAHWRGDLWQIIHETPHLDWLLLTKRPQNIAARLPDAGRHGVPAWGAGWPNVWLGTTVENQAEADRRIPHLLSVPAAKRFLSMEPLLGPVDLRGWLPGPDDCEECDDGDGMAPPRCRRRDLPRDQQCPRNVEVIECHEGPRDASGCPEWVGVTRITLDWVIAGGESGPKARPSHPDWFRSLRDQCQTAGVPFFFKQWGAWIEADQRDATNRLVRDTWTGSGSDGQGGLHWWREGGADWSVRLPKKETGAMLDGREWREAPA